MSKGKTVRRVQASKRQRDLDKVAQVYAAGTGVLVTEREDNESERD